MENKSSTNIQPICKLFIKRRKAECPFCHAMQELNVNGCGEDQLLQWEDYVSIPMVWCWDCMATGFLDPGEFKRYKDIHSTIESFVSDTEEEKFLSTMSDNHDISVPLLWIDRLVRIPVRDDTGDEIIEYLNDVPVQSYNVSQPKTPYARGVDLSHDGSTIRCLVRMPNGTLEEQSYSGD